MYRRYYTKSITNLSLISSLKGLLPAPMSLSLFFLFDKRCVSCLAYLFVISLSKIPSNSCTVRPVNDLKSSGFLMAYHMKAKKGQEIDELLII